MSYKKRVRKWLLVFISAVLSVVALSLVTRAIEADVTVIYGDKLSTETKFVSLKNEPEEFPCTSLQDMSDRGVDIELIAEVESGRELFQMWLYQDPNTMMLETTVSKVMVSGICGLAYTPNDEAITNRVPLDIARQLRLQSYEVLIEQAGGLEAYQAHVTGAFDGTGHIHGPHDGEDNNYLIKIESVDKWALDQLGIELPAGTYEIVDIDDAWQYDYDYDYEKETFD